MSVALDSEEASNAGHSGTTTTLSWSFNNVAGDLLVVCANANVQTGGSNENASVDSITYNGVSMTKAKNIRYGGGTGTSVDTAIFYLVSPATGSNTVQITGTLNGGGGGKHLIGGAVSFSGVDGAAPIGTPPTGTTGTGTTMTSPSITTTSGNYCVAAGSAGSTIGAAGSGATLSFRQNVDELTAGDNLIGLREASPGGANTLSATINSSDTWGMVAIELLASSGAAATVKQLAAMGVG